MRFLLCICLFLASVKAENFEGSVTFSQSATGKQKGLVSGVMASEVKVMIGNGIYRQDEVGGMNSGRYLVRKGAHKGLKIDLLNQKTVEGAVRNLDSISDKVEKFMPDHFRTRMKAMNETETIAGHETEKFKVTRSAFLRPGATMEIWVAKKLEVGRHRYDFNFITNRVVAPLPLSIPLAKGTVLKSVVVENGTTVTTIATEVKAGPLPADTFSVPKDYPGPKLPAAPVPPKTTPNGEKK